MKPQDLNKIYEKFVSDPDWALVEELLLTYIEPVRDVNDIDETMPAEHVKAEVIARKSMANRVLKFLEQTKIIQHRGIKNNTQPFK